MGFSEGNEIGKATRFKPGQSGNPNGRPKSIAKLVRAKILTERPDGTTLADELVSDLLADAQSDDTAVRLATRKELLARIYPIIAKHELASEGDTQLTVSWQAAPVQISEDS